MKLKSLFIIAAIILLSSFVQLYSSNNSAVDLFRGQIVNTPPTTELIRTPGEFEPVQGVVVRWDYYGYKSKGQIKNQKGYNGLHKFLVENIVASGATVYILVDGANTQSSIEDYLSSTENVVFIQKETDSIWGRDYGATTIYTGEDKKVGLVDWEYNRPRPNDDLSPVAVANELDLDMYVADDNSGINKIVATGGNFMTDGFGTAFSSKLIVEENGGDTEKVKRIMKEYMGIDEYILMDTLPYDGIHHIDMHIKLLDEETLLVGQYPEGVADGPQIEENLQYILDNYKTVYGDDFRVVRIPMPGNPASYDNYQTYTNALITNNYVLVPIYGISSDDEALQIYRDAMPGYNVLGYNCTDIISLSGAIHCITHEINNDKVIRIKHPRFRESIVSADGLEINAEFWSPEEILSASVFMMQHGETEYTEYPMTDGDEDGIYSVSITPESNGEAKYYIKANSENIVGYKPQNGYAGGYLTVNLQVSSGITDQTFIPETSSLYQNYPNPFNPSTTIKFYNNKNGNVKLTVYNMKGAVVKELLNETLESGFHNIDFNASMLNSGVYYYALEAGNKKIMKKMLLVK